MTLQQLARQFPADGRVEAIVLRPAREAAAVLVNEVEAEPGRGLLGDRRAATARKSINAQKRDLTLFQAEHLDVLARWSGGTAVDPRRLRRNLIVSGINLIAMRSPFRDFELEWAIGDTVRMVVTGPCDPCSKMEAEFGPGGYNALRGHGGMTARIVAGGLLRVGDRITLAAVNPGKAA